jgi:Icc protein
MAVRIVQISDTHLSAETPEAITNFERIIDFVRDDPPDLVVNTGDLSANGADDVDDLRLARDLHARLPVPWRVVPGNHDLGDVGDDAPQPADDTRRARFVDVFGETEWIDDVGGWRLVGFDTQALQTAGRRAAERWAWLDEALRTDRPTVVFSHRPLMPVDPDEDDDRHRYVLHEYRQRLRDLLARPCVRLVASGHVHQARQVEIDGTVHVWAPSAWATIPESIQPTIGDKVVGAVEIVLGDAGDTANARGSGVSVRMFVPAGVGQHVIGETIPSPYGD